MTTKRRFRVVMLGVLYWILAFQIALAARDDPPETVKNDRIISGWARKFSDAVIGNATKATQVEELIKWYRNAGAKVSKIDPEVIIDKMKERLEKYLEKRKSLAQHLKRQLEDARANFESSKLSHEEANEPCLNHDAWPCGDVSNQNPSFVRYFDARNGTDGVMLGRRNRTSMGSSLYWVGQTAQLNYQPNPNFYGLEVDLDQSAVHVPTPIFARNETIINEIRWSKSFYEVSRDARLRNFTSASWLMFCSKYGFMRFYPAARWVYDKESRDPNEMNLDLFDCRTQEWYIDGATTSKNVIILLDISGSMLGQRFEIARRTMEAIFDTLSENDFFNVLTFNTETHYLYSCFHRKLVQASIRNKSLMKKTLETFSNITNIANYTRALEAVFDLIESLNDTNHQSQCASSSSSSGACIGSAADEAEQILMDDSSKLETTDTTKRLGCNSAVMLITDGADDFYENIFKEKNAEKTVRFFSFLMGEDVTAVREVKSMACNNRGYFAHIANVADVQEKVQKYIEVMSRPLAQLNETNATWTGAYFDRLSMETVLKERNGSIYWEEKKSRRLVTTVAYPVIYNNTFLGVVGAAAPIAELQQRAPWYMLGANSYTFLVDNNGYILFHPQHRPLIRDKRGEEVPKPNYNSMDIMEMEVPYDHVAAIIADDNLKGKSYKWCELRDQVNYSHPLRTYMVDAKDSDSVPGDKIEMTILRAFEEGPPPEYAPWRVYKQTNRYHFRRIKDTLLSLGLAVAVGSEYIVDPPSGEDPFNYREIEERWFGGDNWRLHPDWHYCRPNDTDTRKKYEIFFSYARQMRLTQKLPEECEHTKYLINRLLFDAKVTCDLDQCWIGSKSRKNAGILLAFFSTQTGLTRFVDLGYLDIKCPESAKGTDENGTFVTEKCCGDEQTYMHFIDRSTRAVEEGFYKRAMQFQNGEFVFDVNVTNRVCLRRNGSKSFDYRGREIERESMLITASRSVFLSDGRNKAPLGVVGVEMLYSSFGDYLTQASGGNCERGNLGYFCVLLDEHAHVVYSNIKGFSNPNLVSRDHVGKYFGDTGLLHHLIMRHLAGTAGDHTMQQKIYEHVLYVDFQAMCDEAIGKSQSASSRLLNPLYSLAKLILWALKKLSLLLGEYSFWSVISGILLPAEAFTPSTSISDVSRMAEGIVCDQAKKHFLLNRNFTGSTTLGMKGVIDVGRCGTFCKLTASVSRVPNTNLILVVYTLGNGNDGCRDKPIGHHKLECLDLQTNYKYGEYRPMIVKYATDKIYDEQANCSTIRPRQRRHPGCYTVTINPNVTETPCSRSSFAFRSMGTIDQIWRRLFVCLLLMAASKLLLSFQ